MFPIEIPSRTRFDSYYVYVTNDVGLILRYNFPLSRKDQKKVTKLEAQIPYHEGRGNKEEVTKIKEQIAAIWEKAREASWA